MHYAPQILLCYTVWISVFASCEAKEPLDPELLKKFTKDVESVLSPTLIGELQGAQSNRSAVNVEQTVPRNPEQPKSINDQKPEIRFDNRVYPYHYERSYHYQYPPNPHGDSSRPLGYPEDFYGPRFRPKSSVTDSHDPTYYRSELYNPFGTSPIHNGNSQPTSGLANGQINSSNDRDDKQTGNPESSEILNEPTPLPPNSFAHVDILTSPPQPNSFPNPDFVGFGRPLVDDNYFRPNGDAKNPPARSYQPLPPLESFQNYPSKEFQRYNGNPPSLPESSTRGSQHLPPPFLGSFYPPGYQSHFYNGYRPSEHFNGLFGENFTRSFPRRPSFGGFYPHYNYLPPPPSPAPSPAPASAENKPEDPLPPGGPSSQPIPTTRPDDPAPVAAASDSHYEWKLFFPTKDDVNAKSQARGSGDFTYFTKNFRF